MKLFHFLLFTIQLIVAPPTIAINHPKFFQQQVNHTLKVNLLDSIQSIDVNQSIEYINQSPDTLHQIYIHLWANAWKNNHSEFARQLIRQGDYSFHFATQQQRGGYSHIDFRTDGKKINWGYYQTHEDIAVLYPERPLYPADTIFINIEYQLDFPDAQFSRLGHSNGAYYATQWYPKPAVYDSEGWHPMPYLNLGEFYSEFGNYDVQITLPQNYVTASTGILQTKEEVEFLHQLAWRNQLQSSDIPDASFRPPASSPLYKTLKFKQYNVHDFAWFADKQFRVLMDSITIPSGEKILMYSFFTQNAKQWIKANKYLKETVQYMSSKLGPYPWQEVTAVQGIHSGGANMEYPGITLIDNNHSDVSFREVIVHEVIHNWFYGILASNERKEPWIDEGFTTYYENRFLKKYYPVNGLLGSFSQTILASFFNLSDLNSNDASYFYYMLKAAQHLDQPAGAESDQLTQLNYYAMVYYKSAMVIHLLQEYLGEDLFDRVMKGFYKKWKFSHPSTDDLRDYFQDETSLNLDWFYQDLIGSNKKLDFKLKRIRARDDGYIITIANKGEIAMPYPLSAIKNGEILKTIWFDGFSQQHTEVFFPGNDFDLFQLDAEGLLPDINRNNNSIKITGLIKNVPPVELQLIGGRDNPRKTEIYWLPLLAYNANDGFMPGLAFYNYVFPVAKNDILLMPLYSPGRDGLSGSAWFYRDFYPGSNFIHSVRAGVKYKKYGLIDRNRAYSHTASSVRIVLNPALSSHRKETYLQFTNFLLERDKRQYTERALALSKENYYANRLDFFHQNQGAFNPYQINAEVLQAKQMLRTSLGSKIFFPLNEYEKGFHIRFFAGIFLKSPQQGSAPDFRFSLQGETPIRDPLYENVFIGPEHPMGTLWGNQTTESFGYFKFPTPLGLTWNWLTAINIGYDLPLLPLRLYFDTGTYKDAGSGFIGSKKFPYVAGIQMNFLNDAVTINFPLLMSADIKNIAQLNNLSKYYDKITFTIRFDRINPLEARRKLHLLLI